MDGQDGAHRYRKHSTSISLYRYVTTGRAHDISRNKGSRCIRYCPRPKLGGHGSSCALNGSNLVYVQTSSVSMLVYCILTTVASFVCELRSLACYKRLTATAKEKYHSDFLLLGKRVVLNVSVAREAVGHSPPPPP